MDIGYFQPVDMRAEKGEEVAVECEGGTSACVAR